MRTSLALALLVLSASLAGCGLGPSESDQTRRPSAPTPGSPSLRLEPVLDGLESPTLVTHAPGDAPLYVLEQAGRVLRVENGTAQVALDIREKVTSGGEQGLLGLAFHPAWRENRMAFLDYTDAQGNSVLARYRVAQDGTLDASSEEPILRVEQPYANHNGGHLAFGPDGLLYYGLGDGGAAGDPHGNGQDPRTLLGSLLRLDVNGTSGYEIPPTNPFAKGEQGAPEVWAFGLRNPWRFSFDRATHDLYVADVGQNEWEEVNVLPAGHPGGANFGWSVYEGSHRFKPIVEPASIPFFPAAEYAREGGHCSVVGGYVHRSGSEPRLDGIYLFGDYCSGQIWGMTRAGGEWSITQLLDSDLQITSFGEDDRGDVYVVDRGGRILRVVTT